MSVFAYDPSAVKAWANSVVNYLNGGTESVGACSKKFSEQIEKLVQPNVWTGAAARQNYQNFLDTHKALVAFINNFGESYETAMNEINKAVGNLEVANLGVDTNVFESFGTLSYSELSALAEQSIGVEVVRYDYATISGIGTVLANIKSTLDSVYEGLKNKIAELNNGASMWDGDSAESAKTNLTNVLTTNMNKVNEGLDICIKNISEAAEAAQIADRG